MNTNNIQIVPVEQEENTNSNFSFSNFIHHCLRKWPWFLASVVFCLAVASLYLLRTKPVFTRSATVLIKESATRRMATSDIESVLSFSAGGTMSSKVVNEVIVFQSPALMQEVVKRIGLTTEYYSPSLFRKNTIYGPSVPVSVAFGGEFYDRYVKFNIEQIEDGKSFIITDFVYRIKKEEFKHDKIKGNFGDTLNVDNGQLVISKNPFFTGKWKKPVFVRHLPLDSATSMYCKRFKATSMDVKNKADVLKLELKDYSVQRADDALNMLMNVYNESWVEDKNKMAVSTSEFIENRLSSLEKELGDVDNDISNFKSENLLPDLSAVSSLYMEQTKETARMFQELSSQLDIFRYIKSYLSANPGIETLIPMVSSMGNSTVLTQIAEYNKSLLTRNGLRSNSSEKNPLVMDLNQSLTYTRAVIEQTVDNQIGTISSQLDNLRGVENSNNNRIARNPSQAKYLITVGRQQKVKETLYLYLLQKREENELSRAFSAYNTRIITPPMGVAVPTSPKKMKILLMALLLGLLVPLISLYIIDVTDTKVRTTKDINGLSLPYLGEVPLYAQTGRGVLALLKKSQEQNQSQIVVKTGERNIINESFRIVRTNLEFMEKGSKNTVIISCSFNPGSGKTFLSMNMSAVLAIKGNKVLVIDGDLRRGSLSEYVGSPKKGLCDYLNGEEEDVHKYIVPVTGFKKLDVLPIGKIPPNPTELVSQPQFATMIETLKTEYDYVFIDCPPVDIVADTQIISEYADRTIFVVRAGVFDIKDIPALQKLYEDKRFKNLCYIFNGVDTMASYYGHYGHYGYGYGYGSKSAYYGSK